MTHFLPCTKSRSGQETANLILREIFKLHGFPDDIISDCGPQFVSMFWKNLLKSLGISSKLSSSYHPEIDGQTERTNQTLEPYLRYFINYQQDDWVDFLHLAECSYNNSIHSSIGYSPFFANISSLVNDQRPRYFQKSCSRRPSPSTPRHSTQVITPLIT
jgi:transposase InsO family protein